MFHAKDGFYFQRLPNGSVRIRIDAKVDHWDEDRDRLLVVHVAHETELSESEWPSVVASLTASGENYARWQEARRLHAS